MAEAAASFEIDMFEGILRLRAMGDWRARNLGSLDGELRDFADDSIGRDLIIDVSKVKNMDTTGAMVLQRTLYTDERGSGSQIVGASEAFTDILEQVKEHLEPCLIEPAHRNAFLLMLNRLGKGVEDTYFAALQLLSFIGFTLASAWRATIDPSRIRWTSVVHHMEEAGLDAVPIVGLMSFLIGAVVAFMGAKILSQFNADIFVVELVALSVLREFGVLLSAILLAGRSGSAFTAQIGSMKIREEIDAMQVLGLNPMEVLVLPRVFALIVMLPVLAFIGAMMGMIGGGLVAWSAMDISPALFLARTQESVLMSNFWVGLAKAPFFAFVIGVIGCFQGMEVEGSAESLGKHTTISVVQSLFVVIILDAFFAMFFLEMNW